MHQPENSKDYQPSLSENSFFVKKLQDTARLVCEWGSLAPSGGESIRKKLSINGISIWDIMSPELALYYLPSAVSIKVNKFSIINFIADITRPFRKLFQQTKAVSKGELNWPDGKSILILGLNEYLVKETLKPIIRTIIKDRKITPILLTDFDWSEEAPTQFNYSLNQLRIPECFHNARSISFEIKKVTSQFFGDSKYKALFSDGFVWIWPKIANSFKLALYYRSRAIIPDLLAIANYIITNKRPSVILLTDIADPRTRIFSLAAKKLGVPTVQVQSCHIEADSTEWAFFLDDYVYAHSKSSKQMLVSHGVPAEKVLECGASRYEGESLNIEKEADFLRKKFDIAKETKIILLISTYSNDYSSNSKTEEMKLAGMILNQMKLAVRDGVLKHENIFLLVKPHPLEVGDSILKSWPSSHKQIAIVDKGLDIGPLIAGSDAIISFGSTSTLDAMIMDKPVICPVFPGWVFSDWLRGWDILDMPSNAIELESIIEKISLNQEADLIVKYMKAKAHYLNIVQGVLKGGITPSQKMAQHIYELSGLG